MTDAQETTREAVEDALVNLDGAELCLRLIRRRVQSALEEGARPALLGPALEEIDRLTLRIGRAKGAMAQFRGTQDAAGWPVS